MLDSIFNFFNQGWVGSLIGLCGIILGIVGIFSFKIAKSCPRPVYQKNASVLIGREEDSLPTDVVIHYKEKIVERLTRTRFVLWNKGTEVLDGSNVVSSDPIKITFKTGTNILSFKILKKSKESNNFIVSQTKPNELMIDFAYFDPNEGATIEILHDSAERYPSITGTIKGSPKGFEDLGRVLVQKPIRNKSKRFKFLQTFFQKPNSMLYLMLSGGIIILSFALYDNIINENKPFSWEGIAIGLTYIFLPLIVIIFSRSKYPKALDFQSET